MKPRMPKTSTKPSLTGVQETSDQTQQKEPSERRLSPTEEQKKIIDHPLKKGSGEIVKIIALAG